MTESTLTEVLELRGVTQPQERAELLDEIHLACAAVTGAAEDLRTSLEADLEERRFDTTPLTGSSETAYIEAGARFENARSAATRFLLDHGSEVEESDDSPALDGEPIGLSDEEVAQMEHEAFNAVAAVAQRHAVRLPGRAKSRELIVKLSMLKRDSASVREATA